MSDLNKVQLIGRLGGDPEMRYTASGAAIANLTVATGKKWRDKQTGEQKEATEWHRVVFFQRTAEVVGEFAHKGMLVYVEGELRTRKWQDQSGQDRYTTEIVGREFSMLSSKRDSQPAGNTAGGFRDKPTTQAAAPAGEDQFTDDDIPF